ncbi:heme-binding protein [Desulfovibrio sp. UCD-KL4C]|uniref:GlcG/HbpS family heme-binding protein n=1 Tax=Desulfovibrio sp. UCD-KL4C TaxID=2578120 RepID=UPI0025B8F1CA|nr:heme-binding protein [Desulfovibrio sp. UCD-KL4C]
MRKLSLLTVLMLSIVMFGVLPASAKSPVKTLPGDITLAQSQKILAAALKKAEAIKVPVNIAIVDAGGNLKAFYRQEDAFIGSIDISIKKAKTARYFNMTTRALGAASQVGQPLYGIEVSNDGLVIFAGGVPLVDANNVIIGAIGVSGGSVDEDESIALAGAAVITK